MKLILKEDSFRANPSDLATRLNARQLPLEYLDRQWEVHDPQDGEKGEGVFYPKVGGQLMFFKIFKFPTKGIPTGPALESMNVIKRLILSSVRIITSSPVRYFLPLFLLLPKKIRKKFVLKLAKEFIEISSKAFDRWTIKPQRLCPMAREIYFKGKEFIDEKFKGEENEVWSEFLLIICNLLDYDSAYRYRAQDIGMMIDKDNLRINLSKELKRIFKILSQRERIHGLPMEKYGHFMKLLGIILFFKRKLKYGIIDFIDRLDFSAPSWEEVQKIDWETIPIYSTKNSVGFDYGDWYHCLNAATYDFGGIALPFRLGLRKEIDKKWVETLQKQGKVK